MTLNEMIYDLIESVVGTPTDDEEIDLRKVAFWIKNQRALWLRNQFNKGESIDDEVTQTLDNIEVELYDTIDNKVKLHKPVLRSILTIPGTIERHHKPTIVRVGSLDYTDIKFNIISYDRVPYANSGRFSKHDCNAFLLNNRLHIIGYHDNMKWKAIKTVHLVGVFEDPELAGKFNGGLWNWNSQYPLKSWMYDYMKAEIKKLDFNMFLTDKTNDANSNNLGNGTQQEK